MSTSKEYATGCVWGLLAIAVIVLFVVIALYCIPKDNEFFKMVDSPQPLVYPKQLLSVPGNCKPYKNCFFPSTLSNPVSLNTGKRIKAKDTNKIWCEYSWRDCPAYRDCVDGKCVPKPDKKPFSR